MHGKRRSLVRWIGSLLVWGLALASVSLSAVEMAAGPPRAEVHQEQQLDWSGSRARCVVCHSTHAHNVVLPHPLGPNCSTCHRGTLSRIGCPSCHSIHGVDTPHTTYPTCLTCHEAGPLFSSRLIDTSKGYMSYLFDKADLLYIEDTISLEAKRAAEE
ncbi:MAG: hypothetical protein HC876_19860 [Chloroflexaceae bacterium]|nr:hypothetical protein [Chloroflexaceae bacterium]